MRTDTISSDDWVKFKASFPSAYGFLLSASLKGEYHALIDNDHRNAWQNERLEELEILKELFLDRRGKGKKCA